MNCILLSKRGYQEEAKGNGQRTYNSTVVAGTRAVAIAYHQVIRRH